MTLPVPAGLPDIDVHEAFMLFPAPLALLDTEGRTTLVNTRFFERFAKAGLDTTALRALAHDAHDANGAWQDIRLLAQEANAGTVRARAIRTPHRILLVVEEADGSARHDEAEALRARIGELETRASTDHLTGAWNRAHLDRVIEAELARSLSIRSPVSLVLIDIDHFKNVNDTFGHAVGDLVLRELVARVRAKVRASDLVFRWGGEEFVVLVSGAGYRRAEIVAEGLRKAVAEHAFPEVGTVTISLGVAEHDGDEDPSTWFRRVDAALYEAKQTGRNRVVVARHGNSDAWAAGGAGALHLAWHEAFECGDATIDSEHRELFRLANALIEASLREQANPGAVKAPLGELLAHVQRHFADEEAILERLHYEGLPEHRRAHAGLIRRALMLASKLEAGEAGVGAVVEFLAQDVVARHLMMVDRAFFPLFSGAGMKAQ